MIGLVVFVVVFVLSLTLKGTAYDLFLILITVQVAISVWNQFQGYWKAPQRIPRVNDRSETPPEIVNPVFSQLTNMGFHPIGEAQNQAGKTVYTIWLWGDRAGTTVAEVMAPRKKATVEFSSIYADNAFAESYRVNQYPTLPRIDEPNIRIEPVKASLEDTYARHLQLIGEFGLNHNQPQPMTTVDDYLKAQTTFRRLYSRRVYRSLLLWGAIVPFLWLLSLAILLAVTRWTRTATPGLSSAARSDVFGALLTSLFGLGDALVLMVCTLLLLGFFFVSQFQNFMLNRKAAS